MLVRTRTRHPRRGTTLIESAIVLSVTCLFLIGLMAIGLGVSYYQAVAYLAREGARYASVHGSQYAQVTGGAAADAAAVYNNAILHIPETGALRSDLDYTQLTYSVSWDDPSKSPVYLVDPATNTYRINYVNVTVNYSWLPQAYLGSSAITLTSTSRMPITF
jgi:Flp pilus assembly protein TadG